MTINAYIKDLQRFSSSPSNNLLNNNEELLKELGLFPLPNNVEVTISNDEQFLNLRLKSKDSSDNKHLLFQLPLKGNDLSAYTGSELEKRYDNYTKEYIKEIPKIDEINNIINQNKNMFGKKNSLQICKFISFTMYLIKEIINFGNKINSTFELKIKAKSVMDIIIQKLKK